MMVNELINSLDNRDIALLSWLSILIILLITSKRFRKSLQSLLKALCARPIIISVTMLGCYVFLILYLLAKIGIWDFTQLKTTMFWSVTVGFKSLYEINEIKNKETFFPQKTKELFKVTLLLDFYVNLFKMPLLVELVFLPFMAFIFAIQAIAESKKEFQQVYSIITKFIVLIGTLLLVYVSWRIVTDFSTITNVQTIKNIATPIFLSLLLLPFTYATIIYSAYEEVFVRLDFIIKDKSLHRYTKWSLLRNFRFKRFLLQQWFKEAWAKNFSSKEDIRKSITEKNKGITRRSS